MLWQQATGDATEPAAKRQKVDPDALEATARVRAFLEEFAALPVQQDDGVQQAKALYQQLVTEAEQFPALQQLLATVG